MDAEMSLYNQSDYDDVTMYYVDTNYTLSCTITMHYNLSVPGHKLALVGGIAALGNWDPSRALVAADQGNGWHSVAVNIAQGKTVPCKWIIVDQDNRVIRWEEGDDKLLHTPRIMAGRCHIMAPWNGDASILSVHDRYGTECNLDEVVQFANMDSKTYLDKQESRIEAVVQDISTTDDANDANAQTLATAVKSWKHKVAVGLGAFSGIALASSAIYLAAAMQSTTEDKSEIEPGTPLASQTAWNTGPSLAAQSTWNTTGESNTPLATAQTVLQYLIDSTFGMAYNAIANMMADPPAPPEPTVMEQLTAAVGTAYDTALNGIESLIGNFS